MSRGLTKLIRAIGAEITETVEVTDGELKIVTRNEALAYAIWKAALGWEETAEGSTIRHAPLPWAIQMIYDRTEGRVSDALPPDTREPLTSKVSQLVTERANSLALAAVAVPERPADLDVSDHEDDGPEGPGQEPPVSPEPPEVS
ncbi:MAG: hypothetical protein IMZ50_10805 [Candidatus Atribacteria bacterium]|nr:hypothetical protein [Candidatus Atribacteria bacterium]